MEPQPSSGENSPGGRDPLAAGPFDFCMEWNAENQLKRVLKNAVEQARFAYDPLGRRVERVAGATTTLWAYEGQDALREAVGGTAVKYVHGPKVDEALAQEDGVGAMSHIHADGLGSVVRTSSGAGAVTGSQQYDAFGNLEVGATSGYAFTGREWDGAAGLAYYRARWYDPTIGRFISADPLEFTAGVNFYAYVTNNPANVVDPTGLEAWLSCEMIPTAKGGLLGGLAMYLSGPMHCFIEVDCPGKKPETLELYGPMPGFPDGLAVPDTPSADRAAMSAPITPCDDAPQCSGKCAFEDELVNQFYYWSGKVPKYSARGPNSNTFAARIIRSSGGMATFPRNAYGWNFDQQPFCPGK